MTISHLQPVHLLASLPLAATACASVLLTSCGPATPAVLSTGEPAAALTARPPVDAAGVDAPAPTLRMSRAFLPSGYTARLVIDPGQPGFDGVVDIEGTLDAATSLLWLNARDLAIASATAQQGGQTVKLAVAAQADGGFVGLRPERALGAGPVTLHLEYSGTFLTDDAQGAFVQEEAGQRYVFSQFESQSARLVFPSVDEPWSKVPWQLTLDVPEKLVALSNTPVASEAALGDGFKRVEFAQTRPLPSYLVAFAVGPFELVDGGTSRNGVPIRVATMAGRGRDAGYAIEVTPKILAALEDYFGMPYPYEKLDSLAVPTTVGFSAMEHPGLITYGQRWLLSDPETGTDEQHSWYLDTAAHELAHQWFGNYVTPAYWDDLWLNEGFASWLGAKISRQIEPGWWPPPPVYPRMSALSQDGLASARSVRQPIVTRDDILNAFDGITYSKGAAVLAMFETAMGEDRFKTAVRRHLDDHAWGVATSDDFLAALGAEGGAETAAAFRTFIEQPGAPVVTAALRCESGRDPVVSLTQRRWLPDSSATAEDDAQRWSIPVCVAVGRGKTRSTTCTTLNDATQELALPGACPSWLLANAEGAGYYRVGLDEAAFSSLLAAWPSLHEGERLMVVDDALAAARKGAIPFGPMLDLVAPLMREGSVWSIGMAEGIVGMASADAPEGSRAQMSRWIRDTFGTRARKLGWQRRKGDGYAEDVLRIAMVSAAAEDGRDEALLKEAVKLAKRWRSLPTRTRKTVLGSAVTYSPALFEELLAAATHPADAEEQNDIFYALSRVIDPDQARRVLELMLDPAADLKASPYLPNRLARDPRTRPVAAAFVREHFAELLPRLGEDVGAYWVYALTRSCDPAQRDEVAAWAEANIAPLPGGPRIVAQALEGMDQCIAERPGRAAEVEAWLAKRKSR